MKLLNKPYKSIIAIILFGILFLLPFSGSVHLFDWDEIIYAESAREMISGGDYMTVSIAYEPFLEKPPMFIWFQVVSMKIFGVNEFAARFPNVICGILTLLSVFLIGKKIHGDKFGMIWAVSFATAILPFFYFRTGLIDPWFNLFIFYGITFFIFYLFRESKSKGSICIALSGLFFGLAILTKGPVAILLFGLAFLAYLLYMRGKISMRLGHILLFLLVMTMVGGSWFFIAIQKGNLEVVKDFITYQAKLYSEDFAGHKGFPGFHVVVLLLGVFPSSILLMGGLTKKKEDNAIAQAYRAWMYILMFLVVIVFSLVETKLVHYSSLAYFPMTFIAAWVVWNWTLRKREISRWQRNLVGFISLLIASACIAALSILRNPSLRFERFAENLNPNLEAALQIDAGWGISDYVPPLGFLAGVLLSIRWIRKRDGKGLVLLYGITFLFTISSMLLYVPKVEKMIQRDAITFIKQHSGENERVVAAGYKSFAPYFYGKLRQEDAKELKNFSWYNDGLDSRPVYVVMGVENSDVIFKRYPRIMPIGQSGSYVFGLYIPISGNEQD